MKKMSKIILESVKTRLFIAFYLLTALGAGFLTLYANGLLVRVLNAHLMVQKFDGFAVLLLLTVGIFALISGLLLLGEYFHVDFEYTTISNLARYYTARLLRAAHHYFNNKPVPEIYAGLWTASQATGRFFSTLLRMVSVVVVFIFYGIVVFRIDLWAGIFTVVAIPVYFLVTAGVGNKISDLQQAYVANIGDLATVTQEALENAGNAKTKNAYAFLTRRVTGVLQKIKSVVVGVTVFNGYISSITGLINRVAPLLVIFAAIFLSPTFEGNTGNIMVLFINIPLFLNGASDIHRQFIAYKMTKPFLEKLAEFENAPLETEGGVDITSFKNLRTAGVKVTFEGGRIITVPDFTLKQGEKIMFFGESGIGKSTVFNLIIGLNREYEGDIYINDINLREISLTSLRRVFGITFQHTNALTLDLKDNILLGAEKSDAALAQFIQLTALETQQENKAEVILNNKVLSGGEKSRIGLAQMLVPEPEVMLIDEAFSSVDEEMESLIIKNICNTYPQRAVICISHRNSGKQFFDRVVAFN